jgi:hypothetical protein
MPAPQHCLNKKNFLENLLLHGEWDDDVVLLRLGPGGGNLLPANKIFKLSILIRHFTPVDFHSFIFFIKSFLI